jgi:hypothetical protein
MATAENSVARMISLHTRGTSLLLFRYKERIMILKEVRILFTLVNVTGRLPGAFINHVKIAEIRPADNWRRIFGVSAARREGQLLCIKHAMEMYREERSESFIHSKRRDLFRSNFRVFKINDIKMS